MTPLDPILVREARSLIARASLIAEAPGADFVPSGKRAYESNQPSGNSDSTHDEFRRLVARANTDARLRDAIRLMKEELERLRTPAPPLSTKEVDRRIVVDFRGVDAAWVGRSLGVALEYVCRIRREQGQVPATGRPREDRPLPDTVSDEERRERVRVLHAEEPDLSWRQIAVRLGIHKTQVLRDAEKLGLRNSDRKAA